MFPGAGGRAQVRMPGARGGRARGGSSTVLGALPRLAAAPSAPSAPPPSRTRVPPRRAASRSALLALKVGR